MCFSVPRWRSSFKRPIHISKNCWYFESVVVVFFSTITRRQCASLLTICWFMVAFHFYSLWQYLFEFLITLGFIDSFVLHILHFLECIFFHFSRQLPLKVPSEAFDFVDAGSSLHSSRRHTLGLPRHHRPERDCVGGEGSQLSHFQLDAGEALPVISETQSQSDSTGDSATSDPVTVIRVRATFHWLCGGFISMLGYV